MNNLPHLQLITLPHREIAPSKTQPRTHFAPEKMAELKASLEAHGFTPALSHLLVRPFEYRWHPAHDPRNGMVFEVRTHESSPWQRVRVRFDVPQPTDENAPLWAILLTEDDIQEALKELPKYEIVCGGRRWTVSKELIAEGKLTAEVPAVIEPMSDGRALELQLIENLQRDDLTPMEEAEGIVRLLEMRDPAGNLIYTRETVVAKLGCTPQHVANQRKIARLRGTEVGDALEAGKLSGTHARILASLASESIRQQLLRRVIAPGGPMPTRMLERIISDEFQIELRGAEFPLEDAELVPVVYADKRDEPDVTDEERRVMGGECGVVTRSHGEGQRRPEFEWTCPFVSISEKIPMCTNPECFRLKTAKAHERWMAEINEREGRPDAALSIEDALAVFDQRYGGTRLAFNSGYVELDAAPDESELKSVDGVKVQAPGNWRKLIKGQGVPVFFAKDSAGKVHEIAKRDAARKAAHLNGHLIFKDSAHEKRLDDEKPGPLDNDESVPQSRDSGVTTSDERSEAETLARKAEQERARALHDAEICAVVAAAEARVRRRTYVTLPTGAWTVMVLALAEVLDDYGALQRVVLPRRKIEVPSLENYKPDWFAKEVSSWTIAEKLGFVVEGLMALSIDEDEPGDMAVWAKAFGVDLKAARRAARAAAARGRRSEVRRQQEEKKAA